MFVIKKKKNVLDPDEVSKHFEGVNMGEEEYERLMLSDRPQSEIEALNAKLKSLQYELQRSGRTGKSMADRLAQSLKTANAQFLSIYFSWMDWIRYIRNAVNAVKELDSALTELRVVSNATNKQLENIIFI